jgi:hypothetical protein
MKNLIFSLVLLTFLSSCAIHTGSLSSSLLVPNAKYEDLAIGVAQTHYYFGFGGLSQDALVLEAKRELMKSRPLIYNEQYANYTVSFKYSYFFIYNQIKVTVSADIIRFDKDSSKQVYSEKYQNKVFGKSVANILFNIGDSVFDSHWNGGIITSINNTTATLLVKSASNKLVTCEKFIDGLYIKKPSFRNYNLGDIYSYVKPDDQVFNGKAAGDGYNYRKVNQTVNNETVYQKVLYGKILAFSLKYMMISFSDGNRKIVDYQK